MIRRTRVKRSRGKRRGPWRSAAKRRWIAAQGCMMTRREAQCCHVATGGGSMKCSDELTIPLCPELHDMLDGRVKLPNGEIGRRAFVEYFDLDLEAAARVYHLRWLGEVERKAGKQTPHDAEVDRLRDLEEEKAEYQPLGYMTEEECQF